VAGGLTFLFVNLWNIVFLLRDPSSLPDLLPQFRDTLLYAFILVTVAHLVIDGVLPCWAAGLREKMNRRRDPEEESARMRFVGVVAHLAVLFVVLVQLSPQAPVPCPFEMIRIWVVVIAFLLVLQPGWMQGLRSELGLSATCRAMVRPGRGMARHSGSRASNWTP